MNWKEHILQRTSSVSLLRNSKRYHWNVARQVIDVRRCKGVDSATSAMDLFRIAAAAEVSPAFNAITTNAEGVWSANLSGAIAGKSWWRVVQVRTKLIPKI